MLTPCLSLLHSLLHISSLTITPLYCHRLKFYPYFCFFSLYFYLFEYYPFKVTLFDKPQHTITTILSYSFLSLHPQVLFQTSSFFITVVSPPLVYRNLLVNSFLHFPSLLFPSIPHKIQFTSCQRVGFL